MGEDLFQGCLTGSWAQGQTADPGRRHRPARPCQKPAPSGLPVVRSCRTRSTPGCAPAVPDLCAVPTIRVSYRASLKGIDRIRPKIIPRVSSATPRALAPSARMISIFSRWAACMSIVIDAGAVAADDFQISGCFQHMRPGSAPRPPDIRRIPAADESTHLFVACCRALKTQAQILPGQQIQGRIAVPWSMILV